MLSGLRRECTMIVRDMNHAGASARLRGSARSIVGRARSLRSGEEGQALVETALATMLLLLPLMLAMFSLSMALYSYQRLGFATFTAAQEVGVGRGTLPGGDPCATVATAVTNSLPGWTASKFTYELWITDTSGTSHQFGPYSGTAASTCTTGYADLGLNQPTTVQVSYSYTWLPMIKMTLAGPMVASETVLVD